MLCTSLIYAVYECELWDAPLVTKHERQRPIFKYSCGHLLNPSLSDLLSSLCWYFLIKT